MAARTRPRGVGGIALVECTKIFVRDTHMHKIQASFQYIMDINFYCIFNWIICFIIIFACPSHMYTSVTLTKINSLILSIIDLG